MLSYCDNTGSRFNGKTPQAVVRAMRRAAWRAPGKPAYMQEVADRIASLTKQATHISTESPEAFLGSLVAAGYLVQVEN